MLCQVSMIVVAPDKRRESWSHPSFIHSGARPSSRPIRIVFYCLPGWMSLLLESLHVVIVSSVCNKMCVGRKIKFLTQIEEHLKNEIITHPNFWIALHSTDEDPKPPTCRPISFRLILLTYNDEMRMNRVLFHEARIIKGWWDGMCKVESWETIWNFV